MLRALLDYFRRQSVFRSTYKELSNLSSRQLADIGIDRSMITRIALEAAYGKNNVEKTL